jgi:CRP-like cAMP-binding protein
MAAAPLTNSKLERFYSGLRTVKVKRGSIIFVQDELPRYGYAIKSGYVRAYNYTPTMEEKSVSFVVKNELFPIGWLFSKTNSAFINFVAHTDCELYVVDKHSFHTYISDDSALAYDLLNHSINDMVAKMLQINALEQPLADMKLLYILKYFCLRHGKEILRDLIRINVPLTHKDIAGFCGLSRETVTLEIIKYKTAGLLSVRNRFYSVNTTKLEELLDDLPLRSFSISD